jgi:uncharacterized SAM-binding protein YcdF (DUF218 family)
MTGFQSQRRAGRLFRRLLVATLAALLIWTAGLFSFAGSIPKSIEDPARHTDSIIVLTGGSGRLEEGLNLLELNMAKRLFVSGVYQGVDVKTLFKMFQRNPWHLETRVGIGTATNTLGNATETAEWIAGKGFRSMRLVTASYHMPRSLLEFKHAMPNAQITAHPVFPAHVKVDEWWAWSGTAELIAGEYNKFLFAWLRQQTEIIFQGNG